MATLKKLKELVGFNRTCSIISTDDKTLYILLEAEMLAGSDLLARNEMLCLRPFTLACSAVPLNSRLLMYMELAFLFL